MQTLERAAEFFTDAFDMTPSSTGWFSGRAGEVNSDPVDPGSRSDLVHPGSWSGHGWAEGVPWGGSADGLPAEEPKEEEEEEEEEGEIREEGEEAMDGYEEGDVGASEGHQSGPSQDAQGVQEPETARCNRSSFDSSYAAAHVSQVSVLCSTEDIDSGHFNAPRFHLLEQPLVEAKEAGLENAVFVGSSQDLQLRQVDDSKQKAGRNLQSWLSHAATKPSPMI